MVSEGIDGVDIENLAKRVHSSVIKREYLETRHNTLEDDGLIGLLNLMCIILKHNPQFKTSKDGQEFLNQVQNDFNSYWHMHTLYTMYLHIQYKNILD